MFPRPLSTHSSVGFLAQIILFPRNRKKKGKKENTPSFLPHKPYTTTTKTSVIESANQRVARSGATQRV
jgi:hypothetical protein